MILECLSLSARLAKLPTLRRTACVAWLAGSLSTHKEKRLDSIFDTRAKEADGDGEASLVDEDKVTCPDSVGGGVPGRHPTPGCAESRVRDPVVRSQRSNR